MKISKAFISLFFITSSSFGFCSGYQPLKKKQRKFPPETQERAFPSGERNPLILSSEKLTSS